MFSDVIHVQDMFVRDDSKRIFPFINDLHQHLSLVHKEKRVLCHSQFYFSSLKNHFRVKTK